MQVLMTRQKFSRTTGEMISEEILESTNMDEDKHDRQIAEVLARQFAKWLKAQEEELENYYSIQGRN